MKTAWSDEDTVINDDYDTEENTTESEPPQQNLTPSQTTNLRPSQRTKHKPERYTDSGHCT